MLDLLPQAPADVDSSSTEPLHAAGLRVMKFGGSSLATPSHVRHVAQIVERAADAGPVMVVVSAFQGVTDALIECARLAERGDAAAEGGYRSIADRHGAAAAALIDPNDRATRSGVDALLREFGDVLRGVGLIGCCPPAALDTVASFGERLSALIVAGHLSRSRPSRFVDARDFIATDEQFTRANVNLAATNRAVREYFAALWADHPSMVAVVTGFIGRSESGRTTTIGRNGSDYSAAILGAALNAAGIEIWTDVDGMLTADPKAIPSSVTIPQMTYRDALEMSYAGAKVLHPSTIGPAVLRAIPIAVRNTLNPASPGTVISAAPADAMYAPGSVTSAQGLTLLTLRCAGRSSGRSNAERLSHALAARAVSVVLTSQACSDLSIWVAVDEADALSALEALQKEFCFELERGLATLAETPHQAIVTALGGASSSPSSIAATAFSALDDDAIAIHGFTQGASPRSVSCLVDASEQRRAVRAIHHALFEDAPSIAIALCGVGQVGRALLSELRARGTGWRARGVDVKVIAIADSRRCVLAPEGVDLGRWRDALQASDCATDPYAIAAAIRELAPVRAVLVDCTAGAAVLEAYAAFVDAGCHIVTPNKRAGILPWDRYTDLRRRLAARGRQFLDSTTVGAGLPVLTAVRELIAGGDSIRKIEGSLSGTLTYLFSAFDGSTPFSGLVREAQTAGLTEPDPRDDLRGGDVARKLLILARESGVPLEIGDVEVQDLTALSDGDIERQRARADVNDGVLRYVATLEGRRAHAGLREVPRDHPLAAARGCDNVVAITSDRYDSSPLVIRGPGAGATLTAKAIVSDIGTLLPRATR